MVCKYFLYHLGCLFILLIVFFDLRSFSVWCSPFFSFAAFFFNIKSKKKTLSPKAKLLCFILGALQFQLFVVVVQPLSHVQHFVITWTAACQASLSIIKSRSLLKLMSIEPSNHLILFHLFRLHPSIFPSITGFSNKSVLPIMWPKY